MKRLWAIGAVLSSGLLAGALLAGPPRPAGPVRPASVRQQDDLAPLVLPAAADDPLPPTLPAPGPSVVPASHDEALPLPGVPTHGQPLPGEVIADAAPDAAPGAVLDDADGDGGVRAPVFYASGEYLLWWIRDSHYPVLATTGPFRLTPGAPSPFAGGAGVLGANGTRVLFGGDDVDNEERSGARFTVGGFLPGCKLGAEGSFFFLGQRATRFQVSSADQVIARPFFNLATGREDVETTALPGISRGTLTIGAPSKLWGAEANLQCLLCNTCWSRVRLLGGFRYLNLREGLVIQEDIALGPNISDLFGPDFAFLNNAHAQVLDSFQCHNDFYGGQLGLATQFRLGTWTLDMFGKVALGTTHQQVTIDGGQIIDSPLLGRQTFRGGLLALSSNIGNYERNVFSVVPEAGVTLGKQIGPLRVFAGYNFLFWSNVVRPGDQIDRVLNPFLIPNFPQNPATIRPGFDPNTQRPAFTFNSTSFWAQGLTFGMQLSF